MFRLLLAPIRCWFVKSESTIGTEKKQNLDNIITTFAFADTWFCIVNLQ